MALTVLGVLAFFPIPVAIGWRIAFKLLMANPTPQVKLFFWFMSALFLGLAGALFVATQYLE